MEGDWVQSAFTRWAHLATTGKKVAEFSRKSLRTGAGSATRIVLIVQSASHKSRMRQCPRSHKSEMHKIFDDGAIPNKRHGAPRRGLVDMRWINAEICVKGRRDVVGGIPCISRFGPGGVTLA